MNTNQQKIKSIGIFLILVSVLLIGAGPAVAEMCQIIRIDSAKGAGGTRLEIFPEQITVPAGTCTVWINWVKKGDVQVSFRENAKECIASTESQTGFNIFNLKAGETCYISESLSKGKTSSLVWKEPGIYKYTIELAGKGSPGALRGGYSTSVVTGVIEVK